MLIELSSMFTVVETSFGFSGLSSENIKILNFRRNSELSLTENNVYGFRYLRSETAVLGQFVRSLIFKLPRNPCASYPPFLMTIFVSEF